ncbi:MAG: FkbM family methyltransferase [Bacteroidetes bacterium]|nr:FkbM family methyltransferase [Bacteroidota bacterium]
MSKYILKITTKTKVLNFFRRILKLPIFEQFLVLISQNLHTSFVQKLVPPNYLYKKETFRLVKRNGINFKLDISNVIDHSYYFYLEKPEYHSIILKIQSAQVILDIGSNIGNSSLYFASLNSSAKIISFEPHPNSYKKAIENIKLNNFSNIEIINIGLGQQKMTTKLYEVDEYNSGMNRILPDNFGSPYKLVELDILDDVLKRKLIDHVDFIKIDVEGYELSVLSGSIETLKSKPLLFIEIDEQYLKENKSSPLELIEFLMNAGYSTFYRADNGEAISSKTNFANCHFDLIAQ